MADEGDSQPLKKDSFAALRYKDFRAYLGMRFFFTFAYQMQTFILGLYIYEITHSKTAIAFIGLSEAIPAVIISFYGGYIADKYEKSKMLLLIFIGVFISSLTMFIVTLNSLHAYVHQGWIIPVIYAMIFCNGVARAFYGPATFTIYANSVPKSIFPNASTWSSSTWQLASISGPLVGGLLYAFSDKIIPGTAGLLAHILGPRFGGSFSELSHKTSHLTGITATFVVILFFLLGSLIQVFMLRKYPATFVPKESKWKSIAAGFKFVLANKMMLYAMSLDMFSVLFGGVVALIPVFALDILHVGAKGAGILRAAQSIGAALTMIAMVKFSPMNKPWRNLLIVVAGFGISIIGFGLSTSFYLSILFLFLQGAFDSVSVIIRSTIMQLLTPDDMRGRVSSINSIFITSSNELGDFESGLAANYLGTIPAVLFGGCITLMVVTFTFFKTKKLIPITLEEINPPEKKNP